MLSRLALPIITLFWLVMNFLLWRSEFGGHGQTGSIIPEEVVWQKVLTAPDDSSLEIFHHGRKAGYCRWAANIGQEVAGGKVMSEETASSGLVEKLSNYRIDFEGNLAWEDLPSRIRFDVGLKFTTNRVWQELNLRLALRPNVWEIHSSAASQSLRLHSEGLGGNSNHEYKFSEFQNPTAFLGEFPLPFGMSLPLDALSSAKSGAPGVSQGLKWEARNDWIKIGHTSVRAYRIEAGLLDRWKIVVMVSRAGEILRVDLPDEWALVNDQLINL